jgi:hypothetical protein
MDYKARFYDATLMRWTQPDTIVPGAGNPQSLNRFSYVLNQPILFNDPSGHCVGPLVIVCFVVSVVLMASAIDLIETNSMEMTTASQQPGFASEQAASQQWQDNCMGQCHYASVASPGPNGPMPRTPLTDRYSSAMAGVGQSVAQFLGGMSMMVGVMPPTRYSTYDVRMKYLNAESEMDSLAPTHLTLVDEAEWYFNYRNYLRSRARYLMADRDEAINLALTEPNYTFDELIQHKIVDKGLSGDDIYIDIINSAPKSRTSVNRNLGIQIPE